jgi:hypothetical protein
MNCLNRWDQELKKRREEEERRRKYHADVSYKVYSSGFDADRVDYERVQAHIYSGDYADTAARHEIRLQREAQERREQERQAQEEDARRQQEEYYERMREDNGPTEERET